MLRTSSGPALANLGSARGWLAPNGKILVFGPKTLQSLDLTTNGLSVLGANQMAAPFVSIDANTLLSVGASGSANLIFHLGTPGEPCT